MIRMRGYIRILCILFITILHLGCGNASGFITSSELPGDFPLIGSSYGQSGRQILFAATISMSNQSGEITVQPTRDLTAHWDVTSYLEPPNCEDCIKINVLDFQPGSYYIKFKVTLRNPTKLTGYDVRGTILPEHEELRLINPDGYTDLWDNGGAITINPFKAFGVEAPNRAVAPGSEFSRIYAIRYPSFPELIDLYYVVDVSWPGNCKEPFSITDVTQTEPLTGNGSITDVKLTILDWQDDVSSVHLGLSSINGGTVNLEQAEGNTWLGSISNGPGTSPGVYRITAVAESLGSSTKAFNCFDITVNPAPATPSQGPIWIDEVDLTGEALDIALKGDYAFVAAGSAGLHVVDISQDPPSVKKTIPTENYLEGIDVSGNFVYATGLYHSAVKVFDINNPTEPVSLPDIPTIGVCYKLRVYEDRLYVLAGLFSNGLQVYELDGQGGGSYAGMLGLATKGKNLDVNGYFVYIADDDNGLVVVDAHDPAQMEIKFTTDTPYMALDVAVSGNRAYVVGSSPDLQVFNITVPWEPIPVDSVDLPMTGFEIRLHNEKAYIAAYSAGLQVVDTSLPGLPVIASAGLPDYSIALDIDKAGDRAFVASNFQGLQVVDISTIGGIKYQSRHMFKAYDQISANRVLGNFLFSADYKEGLYVTDITDILNPLNITSMSLTDLVMGLEISGNFLLVPGHYKGVQLVDISIPDKPVIIGRASCPGIAYSTFAYGEQLYAAMPDSGVASFDISDPASPAQLWMLKLPGSAFNLEIASNYLFAASAEAGLAIIDISNPGGGQFLTSIETPGLAEDIQVVGNIAYVADGPAGLTVIDVTEPHAPQITGILRLPGFAWQVEHHNGYLYVASVDSGVQVVSIDDPLNPELYCSAGLPFQVTEVYPYGDSVVVAYDYIGIGFLTIE